MCILMCRHQTTCNTCYNHIPKHLFALELRSVTHLYKMDNLLASMHIDSKCMSVNEATLNIFPTLIYR